MAAEFRRYSLLKSWKTAKMLNGSCCVIYCYLINCIEYTVFVCIWLQN